MKFKIKKILTPRQMTRAKFALCCGFFMLFCQFGAYVLKVNADNHMDEVYIDDTELMLGEGDYRSSDSLTINWNGQEWGSAEVVHYPRGKIVYTSTNTVVCNRYVPLIIQILLVGLFSQEPLSFLLDFLLLSMD